MSTVNFETTQEDKTVHSSPHPPMGIHGRTPNSDGWDAFEAEGHCFLDRGCLYFSNSDAYSDLRKIAERNEMEKGILESLRA